MIIRVGHGYDVHRFAEGRKLIICGTEIPYMYGLMGHSDADVATHAIMDSLLGAAGLGDIGRQFPDTDPQYKGINSLLLLDNVYDMLKKNNWHISNIDLTIVAQEPRISPHIEKMKSQISTVLNDIPVNIKATTEEGLGFTGEKKGISATAVSLIYM